MSKFNPLIALPVLLHASVSFAQAGESPPPQSAPPPQDAPAANTTPAAAPPPATPDADADRKREEAEIAAELAKNQQTTRPADTAAPPATDAASGASASSRGLSNLMNPAISAVGLFLAGGTSRSETALGVPGDLRTGIFVQEVELRASAIVDPFFRADIAIAGNAEEIGFEEAYITTLELPRVTLRAGQMHATLGRHNQLHTHAFPFITAPLPWRALIGEEGLSDPGISADVLLPLPFYTELTAQVFQGEWAPLQGSIEDDPTTAVDEAVPDKRHDRDFAYVGHLKTLTDLSDSTTLELGGSYLGGRNGFGGWSNVAGADVTLKWKPIEAERYAGIDWTSEYLWDQRHNAPTDHTVGGGYTALRFQFAQRWWLQARGAVLGLPASDSGRTYRGEALGAFVPSEFSALRLQYGLEKADQAAAPLVHEVFVQAVFSIGPHPAHAY